MARGRRPSGPTASWSMRRRSLTVIWDHSLAPSRFTPDGDRTAGRYRIAVTDARPVRVESLAPRGISGASNPFAIAVRHTRDHGSGSGRVVDPVVSHWYSQVHSRFIARSRSGIVYPEVLPTIGVSSSAFAAPAPSRTIAVATPADNTIRRSFMKDLSRNSGQRILAPIVSIPPAAEMVAPNISVPRAFLTRNQGAPPRPGKGTSGPDESRTARRLFAKPITHRRRRGRH